MSSLEQDRDRWSSRVTSLADRIYERQVALATIHRTTDGHGLTITPLEPVFLDSIKKNALDAAKHFYGPEPRP